MTDVFDERKDLKTIKGFVSALRKQYEDELHRGPPANIDPDEMRMRNKIVTHWPGDDVVGQIVKDTCRQLINKRLIPEDMV